MRIVILTGAGISAESGLSTFRDKGGIWSRYDLKDLATPEAFARNPAFVHEFYNMRRANVRKAKPNPAHESLARLEKNYPGEVTLVTQNVDDLHERAGHSRVIHMHGRHGSALCAECGHRWEAPEVMRVEDPCPACGRPATRPDVVWFGEIPYHMDEILGALARADLFVAIGTSGTVYPAAGFVAQARETGSRTLELNLESSAQTRLFDETRTGPATEIVPQWVDEMLA
ncbi:NAD-dependent deacylase [Ostreiculturibacter nitratireducens]|uniref:NAD-dependent deacylase n=1 Tax=Ostreiculturibacter nitratireducens TaxID=3075226 RepID=UPI0031B5812A